MPSVLRLIRRTARHVERVARALDVPDEVKRVEKRTDFSRCARPVLLLHGFLSSRRTFDILERRLRRDGYGVFSLDLGGLGGALNTRGIDDLADLVRAKIERIYARNPGMGPLTIVGHSKGGLIAAYYVKKLGGWRRTRAVVTLGTPHHGTPLAYLGLPLGLVSRSVWQMRPGSDFLERLHDGAWPAQVRLTSVWSRRDAWSPYPTAVLETHGLPHLANVEVKGDHRAFLTSKRIYEAVLQEIRAGEAGAPVVRGPLTAMRGGRTRAAAGSRERTDVA
jgi:pimeloyl-ACP methyl ester carboxylesterase